MKRWEYKLIGMEDMVKTYAPWESKYGPEGQKYPYGGRVLTALNKLGQLGWEYIEHSGQPYSHGVMKIDTYVFKREKNSG